MLAEVYTRRIRGNRHVVESLFFFSFFNLTNRRFSSIIIADSDCCTNRVEELYDCAIKGDRFVDRYILFNESICNFQ